MRDDQAGDLADRLKRLCHVHAASAVAIEGPRTSARAQLFTPASERGRAGLVSDKERPIIREYIMRKAIFLAAVCALAACGSPEPGEADATSAADTNETAAADGVDPAADAGFEAVAPGQYEVLRANDTVDQLTILPGMTWAMVFSDGEAAGGTIFAQGGKNCFVTEGVEDHQCFQGSEPEADGSMEVTAEDGEVMTVRPLDSFE